MRFFPKTKEWRWGRITEPNGPLKPKIHFSTDPWFQILVSAVDPEMSFESVEDMRQFILTSMENEHRRTNPT